MRRWSLCGYFVTYLHAALSAFFKIKKMLNLTNKTGVVLHSNLPITVTFQYPQGGNCGEVGLYQCVQPRRTYQIPTAVSYHYISLSFPTRRDHARNKLPSNPLKHEIDVGFSSVRLSILSPWDNTTVTRTGIALGTLDSSRGLQLQLTRRLRALYKGIIT